MSRIFSTQLTAIFNRISKDEFVIEDAARLLAQAAVGDGHIYIKGFGEMQGVALQATEGPELLHSCQTFPLSEPLSGVSSMDRVLICSKYSNDVEAVEWAKELVKADIPFVAISTVQDEEEAGLDKLADIHIDLGLKRGLVPTETGDRIGYPSLMAALFAYHCIYLSMQELLEEIQ
ncbi:MAG: DUF2529 domain-containing protein [Bacillus sp. (in: firmicutes)]